MKRFTSALALSVSLLFVLSFWLFGPIAKAKEDPILTLLNLPAPPPINPLVGAPSGNRPVEFYDKENPPPDNAPIEELMEYWSRQSTMYQELGYNPKPSSTVLNRIVSEIEKEPKKITDFLNLMQDDRRGIEMVSDAYKRLSSATDDGERETRRSLKTWLTRNTDEFSDDLARTASGVRDVGEYVSNQDELLALTRVNWDKAGPMVNRLYNDGSQKVSKVLATWALYKHAMESDAVGDVDRYRDELKAVVENKEATDAMRDLALDALLKEKEWGGREEWYYTLLGDETLNDLRVDGRSYTGLTTMMYYSPDGKYVDRMLQFAGSDNIWVRTAAAKNLLLRLNRMQAYERNEKLRENIVRALMPWLSDPKWIKEEPSRRLEIIRALQQVKMPDAVPGLIAALDEKETTTETRTYSANAAANAIATAANTASYAANSVNTVAYNTNSNRVYRGDSIATTYYPLRSNAVMALEKQADGRAAGALRRVLAQVVDYERSAVVKALLASNGFSTEEQVAAIEFLAKNGGDPFDEAPEAASNSMRGQARIAMLTALGTRRTVIKPAEVERDESGDEFEDYGKATGSEADAERYTVSGSTSYDGERTSPLTANEVNFLLGSQLLTTEDVSDDLVRTIADRVAKYDKADPVLAESLRQIMLGWNSRAVNTLLLHDLKAGRVDAEAVIKLLSVRKELRETQGGDVRDIQTGSPMAQGIAPCLLEDGHALETILDGDNDAVKIAALACSRLIRMPLPVVKVTANLASKNKLLSLAAERYLESEDSPDARRAVLALHPNEAKILGATTAFEVNGTQVTPGENFSKLFATVNPYFASSEYSYATFGYDGDVAETETEKRLQKEVLSNAELLGVYAYDNNFVHIFKDKAVFSWSDDPARYRERVLEQPEFEHLKEYLTHFNVDQLPPFLACNSECDALELLMIGKGGGRRVFLKGSEPLPEFFAGLDAIFEEMKKQPAKLKYYAGGQVPGLEVLFADEKKAAKSVWKNGADLRVLVTDADREKAVEKEIDNISDEADENAESDLNYEKIYKLRASRRYESYGWHHIINGELGPQVSQPEQAEYIPAKDGGAPAADFGQWKAKAAGIEIRADDTGLYKISGGRSVKIKTGNFSDPVIAGNGRWVVASNYSDESGIDLVRVNLLTNKSFGVNTENEGMLKPIAFIPSINRFLLASYGEDEHGEYEDESYNAAANDNGRGYYFLNPDTGVLTPTAGEVRPLGQQTFRALQPTGTPGEFWAALPRGTAGTIIGIYSTRTFTLKPLLKLPKIIFDSTEMWVDAAEGKAYFTYQGHLLSAPIATGPR